MREAYINYEDKVVVPEADTTETLTDDVSYHNYCFLSALLTHLEIQLDNDDVFADFANISIGKKIAIWKIKGTVCTGEGMVLNLPTRSIPLLYPIATSIVTYVLIQSSILLSILSPSNRNSIQVSNKQESYFEPEAWSKAVLDTLSFFFFLRSARTILKKR